jgi:hypothetical protein
MGTQTNGGCVPGHCPTSVCHSPPESIYQRSPVQDTGQKVLFKYLRVCGQEIKGLWTGYRLTLSHPQPVRRGSGFPSPTREGGPSGVEGGKRLLSFSSSLEQGTGEAARSKGRKDSG